LTNGPPDQVADRLNDLMSDVGLVKSTDHWMPQGFNDIREAQLHKAPHLLPEDPFGQSLKSWWLATADAGAVTPNWDIASTCTIGGKRGLLLVEAKAHVSELNPNDYCAARSQRNFDRIADAIREASDALNIIGHGWHLTHEHHYQLCNRFAWSWKIASLGVPVALVYLGFLNANEMADPLPNEHDWRTALRDYSQHIVPDSAWGSALLIDGVPIYPLVRTLELPLNSNVLPAKGLHTT
jgi:hypothetical protein